MPETATLTLADFLLARIAEDESAARSALSSVDRGPAYGDDRYGRWRYEQRQSPPSTEAGIVWNGKGQSIADFASDYSGPHIVRWQPARVLAECKAKRLVVEECQQQRVEFDRRDTADDWPDQTAALMGDAILGLLALPYAEHPDFQDDWRP